jgi:hypothetical protein
VIEFTDTEYCITEECNNEVKEEGDTCQECKAEQAYWRKEWDRSGRREYEQARDYKTNMIEAGRSHLLPEGEREL